jgi:pimeloyl-ACP methyl ester carboxylesterase
MVPLVLIGGAFQTKESWGRIERDLLQDADVLTVDLPGFGAGAVPPEEYGAEFLADALGHILDEVGLSTVSLVGGSYGTAIAYLLAQRQGARVEKLMLIGTMLRIPEYASQAVQRTIDLLAAGNNDEFVEATLALMLNLDSIDYVTSGARVRRFLTRRLMSLSLAEAEQHIANTRRLLRQASLDQSRPPAMPLMVVAGEFDNFTTPDLGRELAAACPDSWSVVVADADHMLPLERPSEVAELIRRFAIGQPLVGLPYCRRSERISGAGARKCG